MIARLSGVVQPYAWGSPVFIPELLGTEPTGEPQAELWLGAHPSAPSVVDGRPLDALIAADPERMVGERSVSTFGARLPYLMKVLAAQQPLSLQAHPSRAQAEAGYAREEADGVARDAPNRVYRDDWPKPEVLCALMPTEALCGFRDPDQTYALVERLGVPGLTVLVSPLADSSTAPAERVATVFERLLRLEDTSVVTEVERAAERVPAGDDAYAKFAATARDLGSHYPGDPGVLAALLMNRVALATGDALFLPAGNLHAYLTGGGIELMANSDNVMRGGLTPKHIDVAELLTILDFEPGVTGRVEPVEETSGVWRYPTPAPEFALWRLDVAEPEVTVPGVDTGRIIIVTSGRVRLAAPGSELVLTRGQSAFLGPDDTVVATGGGTAFIGGPGFG